MSKTVVLLVTLLLIAVTVAHATRTLPVSAKDLTGGEEYEVSCEGIGEEDCMMMKKAPNDAHIDYIYSEQKDSAHTDYIYTQNAHTDYIYTQNPTKPSN